MKTYSELILLPTHRERFEYLKLSGGVGVTTFGGNRYLNQSLYTSHEWRSFRDRIITRDLGCDLGCDGYEIPDGVPATIHHLNPLTIEQVLNVDPCIFDPNNVITVTERTHKAIHYGDYALIPNLPPERVPGDTCPWRQTK